MAELYRRLGADLLKSERPKALSGEALEQYDLLLEEQAFPFEEKAIALHELNAARTTAGIYDDFVRQSFDALSRLKPARYGKTEAPEELTIDLLGGAEGSAPLDVRVRFLEAVAGAGTDAAHAELEFKALSGMQTSYAGALLNGAIIASRHGRYVDAERALTQAAKISPTNAAIQGEMGLVLRNLGRFADAERAYRAALGIDSDSVLTRRNLGVLLDLYLGRSDEAVVEWRRAVDLQGGDKQLEGWIAECSHRSPAANRPVSGVSP